MLKRMMIVCYDETAAPPELRNCQTYLVHNILKEIKSPNCVYVTMEYEDNGLGEAHKDVVEDLMEKLSDEDYIIIGTLIDPVLSPQKCVIWQGKPWQFVCEHSAELLDALADITPEDAKKFRDSFGDLRFDD